MTNTTTGTAACWSKSHGAAFTAHPFALLVQSPSVEQAQRCQALHRECFGALLAPSLVP